MKRPAKMSRTFLILSCLSLSMCAAAPFPKEKIYVVDVTNMVCAEYEIIDLEKITLRPTRELDLLPGGPCDRAVGWSHRGFKKVQNWVRDQIKEGNN